MERPTATKTQMTKVEMMADEYWSSGFANVSRRERARLWAALVEAAGSYRAAELAVIDCQNAVYGSDEDNA